MFILNVVNFEYWRRRKSFFQTQFYNTGEEAFFVLWKLGTVLKNRIPEVVVIQRNLMLDVPAVSYRRTQQIAGMLVVILLLVVPEF